MFSSPRFRLLAIGLPILLLAITFGARYAMIYVGLTVISLVLFSVAE